MPHSACHLIEQLCPSVMSAMISSKSPDNWASPCEFSRSLNLEAARLGLRHFQLCWDVCQISERYDHINMQPGGFVTSQIWAGRRHTAQWIDALVSLIQWIVHLKAQRLWADTSNWCGLFAIMFMKCECTKYETGLIWKYQCIHRNSHRFLS